MTPNQRLYIASYNCAPGHADSIIRLNFYDVQCLACPRTFAWMADSKEEQDTWGLPDHITRNEDDTYLIDGNKSCRYVMQGGQLMIHSDDQIKLDKAMHKMYIQNADGSVSETPWQWASTNTYTLGTSSSAGGVDPNGGGMDPA